MRRSRVNLTSEEDATYKLTVDGRMERFSGALGGGGEASGLGFTLPNGSYTAHLEVTDQAGNVRRAQQKFRVAVSELAPQVRVAAARSGADRLQFTITAPPRSQGTLSIGDSVQQAFTADADGKAGVTLRLPDGRYPAPVIKVTDAYGRTGLSTGKALVVDTVAPALTVVRDAQRATHGDLVLAVTTERGARIAVTYGSHAARAFPGYTAGQGPATLTRALDPGTYDVTVTATDAQGNVTTKRLHFAIGDSWTAGEWLLFLLKLLLVIALIIAVVMIRYRTRPAREAKAYRAALQRHERDLQAWEQERERLVDLAEFAAEFDQTESADGDWPPAWGKRRRGEQVRWVTAGELVQPAANGASVTVRDTGTVIVTDQRVLHVGKTKREWLFAKLLRVEHPGAQITWMQVSNRTNLSGVQYRHDSARTRLAIELATAAAPSGPGVVSLLARLREALTAHDRARPRQPAPPDQAGPGRAVVAGWQA
ncbi:hypothetical protein [Actinacidiphila soli]|uniref:hypothetical protein n=1 Tax=Actinacidiphila soli TaxID=2487275 RepID=UPI0013E34572|nr:hypothetical protein [Actinacidiphila soli]